RARSRKARHSGADDDHFHDVAFSRCMRLIVSILLASACARGESRPPRRIALSPCRIKGSGMQAQCGTLRVPENRQSPSGQIDLWGGSYGTRASLAYLRDHGQHVRAAVLDGVAPPSQTLPVSFARDAQRSMDMLFDSCGHDAACAKAFPSLHLRFADLLQK